MADPIYIGFDLGGTKMLAGAFDEKLKLIATEKTRTRDSAGPSGPPSVKVGVQRILDTIEKLLRNNKLKPSDVKGIGIGAPGPIDMDNGVLVEAVNLGWSDVPLRKHLAKAFGCPVQVGNDVDLGVYGEYLDGAGKGAKVLLGASPGTGLGGGLVVRGEIYRGARLSCLEIGHVRVQPWGPPCGCGQRGCLEAMCSRLSIAREAVAHIFRGDAPVLESLIGGTADLRRVKSGVLSDSVAKDEVVRDTFRRAMKWLGVGIGGLVNVLGPDRIVIGGGLVEAMPDLVIERVRDAARKAVMRPYRDSFEIVAAELGDDAVITGGAGLARAARDDSRS